MTEDQINEHIGDCILQLRIKNKFKQKDMSELLGITRTSIVNIEAGRQRLSNLKLWKLASLFGVSIDSFFPPLTKYKIEEGEEREVVVVKKIKAGKKFITSE